MKGTVVGIFKRLIMAVILLPVFIGMLGGDGSYSVKAEDAKTVVVGFCRVEGFVSYDELGAQQGYCVDYLERIAQITGWNYEFVELTSLEQGRKKLLSHEIDILAPCKISLTDMEIFDYSQYSFGTEYLALVVDSDTTDIYYEDYSGMDGAVVGVLDTFTGIEDFEEYEKDNGFSTQIKYYKNTDSLNAAFEKGDIDLMLMNQMMVESDQKIVARFAPYPFYFLTWKGNDDTLAKLNSAMQNLKNTYPSLENELTTTYFPLYNVLYYTREEQEFIDSLGTIKVAYIAENTPISFKNSEGELDGISKSIFEKIQEISGLKFEYEVLPEGDITYDYLREQGFDLITGVRYNRSNLYSRGILITNPYLSSKMVLVGDSGDEFDTDSDYTVAVVSGSQTLKSEITSNYPNFNVVTVNSVEECFECVRTGKTDLLMTDRYIANYWLSKPLYANLYTIPVDELMDELCFSVVVDIYGNYTLSGLDGVELVSVINKTLSQISEDEIDEIIISENNNHRYTYTFEDFLYIYRYAVGIGIITVVIIIIFLVYSENLRRKARSQKESESRKIAIQNKRYQKMMDSSGEMLYDLNIMGESGFTSEQIKQKFGWSLPEKVTEFSSDKIREMFHINEDDWSSVSDKVKISLESNAPSDCIVRIVDQCNQNLWCKIYFYPLYNDENRLISIIGKIEDVDKDIKEKDQLKYESQTDGMTGLLNKCTFENKAISQLACRLAYNCAVIFVDLDHFKMLNDTLGHRIGDNAIKDMASNLKDLFRTADLVSRFGGDEFCIMVWDIPELKLRDKLSHIVSGMNKSYSNGTQSVDVTASVGAVYCTLRDADFKTLLDLADIALYEAKDRGRNQYVLKEI